jgi:ferric-dicitrate binding protein FerR (iron transport regulator)
MEELAANPSFRRWTLFNDAQENAFWEEWLDLNPDKAELVEKAQQFLYATEASFDKISDEEVANEIYRLSHAIGENTGKKSGRIISFRPQWYQVAASVLLLIGMGWWINKQYVNKQPISAYQEILSQIQEPLKIEENSTQKPRIITLSDGSTILLQPKSRVTFPTTFTGNKREVFLSGEAFFEVAKNPQKPFYVYANTLATKVLGTSFKVTAFENEGDVKVVVKTGKVSVFPMTKAAVARQQADDKLGGMVLTPNQQIVFASKELRLTRSLIADPKVLEMPIQSQSFVFKGTPIKQVFETLEKSYGVKIIFDAELMKDCYLTASLSDEPLFEKIDLICKTIGAQYEQMDASIIINSKGC